MGFKPIASSQSAKPSLAISSPQSRVIQCFSLGQRFFIVFPFDSFFPPAEYGPFRRHSINHATSEPDCLQKRGAKRKIMSFPSRLLFFGLIAWGGGLAFNERLGFFHEPMDDNPVSPSVTDVTAVECCELSSLFSSFGQSGTGIVSLF